VKYGKSLFAASLVVALAVAAYQLPAYASPADVEKTVVFTSEAANDGLDKAADYNMDNIRSVDDLMFLETKAGEVVDTTDGTVYPLNLASIQNGTVACQFAVPDAPFVTEDMKVTMPVVYVENPLETPMEINLEQPTAGLDIKVSDSKVSFPDAEQGVLVEFTAEDVQHLPYRMNLVSNGEVFDNYAETYYYSNDTGDFLRGEWIFFGLTIEDIGPDATLVAASTFDQYVPASYDFVE